MIKIKLWCVTANHGFYGNQILVSRVSTDKETAIKQCLSEIEACLQSSDKEWLRKETPKITQQLLAKSEYEQRDDGLRIIVNQNDLSLSVNVAQ